MSSPEDERRFVTRDDENPGVTVMWWLIVLLISSVIVFCVAMCRADTTKVFQAIEKPNDTLEVKQSDGTIAVYVWCRVGTRMPMDTVYPYKWPDSVVRARGLDSVYTLPYDTTVWDTLGQFYTAYHISGHWTYFNLLNGKRVNVRIKP